MPVFLTPSLKATLSISAFRPPNHYAMPATISLAQMRQLLYSAVVCDSLDSLGFRNQSPRVALAPLTVETLLIGRCRTTLWADMFHEDPRPYELELQAV